jgi:hypothetical protein
LGERLPNRPLHKQCDLCKTPSRRWKRGWNDTLSELTAYLYL